MSKPLTRPFSKTWYLRTGAYRLFMLREFTSLFIGAYLIFLLVLIGKLGDDPAAAATMLQSGWALVLHLLALAAAMLHSITWFNATPKVMPLFIGDQRVAAPVVSILAGYLPWLVATVVVFLVFRVFWMGALVKHVQSK
jgi:fumarate reductase subunit C